ncbi:ISAs1 family transposase [Jiella sonneratiae]|uniref:ISAs1 family transposase n=1 Tax=Jiella sonneratiae TaxID=2816856 RepID=A0ABS3JAB7_9HYPH|nr:ISAs1 family transposase [Jiella sonneratiae]MBO0906590.1 ISAs1 family transposase [Jiella sonneratiae]
MDRFVECFSEVEDPRAGNARHDLVELLFIALLASLCGARSCEDFEEFGLSKRDLLAKFLTLRHGTPSHDTFSRVFRLLDPAGFEKAFLAFMARFAEGLAGVVAFDGKSLKRAYDKGGAYMPKMMVSAFAAETRLTLANLQAAGGNERDAVLQLVDLISLKGCLVTADALHCHEELAGRIVAGKGDYALRLKANQPTLLAGAKAALAGAGVKSATDVARRNGKAVIRTADVAPAAALAVKTGFPGLKAVARLTVEQPGAETEQRFYLLSRKLTPERLIQVTRSHWAIENSLHWILDTAFAEDHARSRKDNAPHNLAVMRRLALNVARLHPDKTPMRRKLLKAGWDESFFFESYG